ncbi:MAG: signal peptidase I [Lachnospiraceae bacterium]|nr:signal peptidase I [Lachnospiraceae bacterium]
MKLYDEKDSRRGLHMLIVLMHIVTVGACVLFLGHIFGSRFSMVGSSMAPQIEDEEVVLINRAVYMIRDPERFDPILFETESGKRTIKRVIGLPGETVKIVDGVIYVDGSPLTLPSYMIPLASTIRSSSGAVTLPGDSYYVLGDNPQFSEDSRNQAVGLITKKQIIGKPWSVILPLKKARFIP